MIRYERHTTVLDNIKRIEDVSREDIETALFMRRINKMEKDALEQVRVSIDAAKQKVAPPRRQTFFELVGDASRREITQALSDSLATGLGAYRVDLFDQRAAALRANQRANWNMGFARGLLGGFPW